MSRCDVESRHPADAGTETSNSPAEAPQGHEMRRAGKNDDDDDEVLLMMLVIFAGIP